jgi:nucleoid-associated protein YgaU
VAPATTNAVTVRVTAGTNQSTVVRISSSARSHVVQRGESLWSIASDRLGDGASAAQVSREVSRLWELNEERIGTGSPDLLYAGTRLRLR